MPPRRRRQPVKSQHHFPRSRFDYPLLLTIILLLLIGVIMVYEASVVEAYQLFSDKAHFAKLQLTWSLIGLVVMFAATLTPPQFIKRFAGPAFFTSVFLLLLVLIPGVGSEIQGARRWLNFGFSGFQPSELTKLTLIIYLAALFEKKTSLLTFLTTLGIVAGLVMFEPDLGTTIIIATIAIAVYYLARAPLTHFFAISITGTVAALGLIFSSPYRRERLLTFLDPSRDPLGASYHIRQVLIAIGSGGFLGTGIGRSLQKYQYLPESTTDSIFAVIAEEFGFIGTIVIIALFAYIAHRGLTIAQNLENKFMSLLAAGITVLISFQAFLNLSAMSALVPLTGVTLPYISYGGSSLVITLAASGILLNLSRHQRS